MLTGHRDFEVDRQAHLLFAGRPEGAVGRGAAVDHIVPCGRNASSESPGGFLLAHRPAHRRQARVRKPDRGARCLRLPSAIHAPGSMVGLDRMMGMANRAQGNAASGQSDIFGVALGAEPEKLHCRMSSPGCRPRRCTASSRRSGSTSPPTPSTKYKSTLEKMRRPGLVGFPAGSEARGFGRAAGRHHHLAPGAQDAHGQQDVRPATLPIPPASTRR